MRKKLVFMVGAIAALSIGAVSSNAALVNELSMTVKIKKAGAPGTVKISLLNEDNAGLVPQRISKLSINSRVAKWYAKGAAQCKSTIPTNARGDNDASPISPACPRKSKIGTGKFTVDTGTVGQPIPADLGTISGDVVVYNYKPPRGSTVALLFEIKSDVPVQNAHQYTLAKLNRRGTLSAEVPNTTDLPPVVQQFLVGRTTSLTRLGGTLRAPKQKRGKRPFFTLKNTKNLDFKVRVERDNG